MIKVSEKALNQIKDELENIKAEMPSLEDPYIRLYMTYG